MKIATWNVNGIRARASQFHEWIEAERPDVVCLQELKAELSQVPEVVQRQEYHAFWQLRGTIRRGDQRPCASGVSDGMKGRARRSASRDAVTYLPGDGANEDIRHMAGHSVPDGERSMDELRGSSISCPGVTVYRKREMMGERPVHAAPADGVIVHAGRPVRLRWAGDGITADLRVGRGDVFVLPAGLPHSAAWNGPMEFVSLFLAPELVEEAATEVGRPAARPTLRLGHRDRFLEHAVLSLADGDGLAAGAGACAFAEAVGRAVALRLVTGRMERTDRPTDSLLPRRVRRVAEYVRAHVTSSAPADLTLAGLAAEAGVSPWHFARAFRAATGEPPHRFVIRCRLEEAERLLVETDWTVARVALAVGYANPGHFAQAFRRHSGRAPAAYRANHRG